MQTYLIESREFQINHVQICQDILGGFANAAEAHQLAHILHHQPMSRNNIGVRCLRVPHLVKKVYRLLKGKFIASFEQAQPGLMRKRERNER